MRYDELIVCETAIIDSKTNFISFINILENITIFGIPAMGPKATIIAQLVKDAEDVDETVELNLVISINKNELLRQPVVAEFKGRSKARLIIEFPGIPITEVGALRVELLKNEDLIKAHDIDINLVSMPNVKTS